MRQSLDNFKNWIFYFLSDSSKELFSLFSFSTTSGRLKLKIARKLLRKFSEDLTDYFVKKILNEDYQCTYSPVSRRDTTSSLISLMCEVDEAPLECFFPCIEYKGNLLLSVKFTLHRKFVGRLGEIIFWNKDSEEFKHFERMKRSLFEVIRDGGVNNLKNKIVNILRSFPPESLTSSEMETIREFCGSQPGNCYWLLKEADDSVSLRTESLASDESRD